MSRWPEMTTEQRFWSKVSIGGPEDCWVWQATKSRGYGQLRIDGKMVYAHRFAYELATGEPLGPGVQVDHRCHNTACVNPLHLREATNKQNCENFSGAMSNSSTRVRGVYPHGNRFRAQVGHNYQKIHLGIFDTVGAAEAAVKAKRLELYTHNEADRRAS